MGTQLKTTPELSGSNAATRRAGTFLRPANHFTLELDSDNIKIISIPYGKEINLFSDNILQMSNESEPVLKEIEQAMETMSGNDKPPDDDTLEYPEDNLVIDENPDVTMKEVSPEKTKATEKNQVSNDDDSKMDTDEGEPSESILDDDPEDNETNNNNNEETVIHKDEQSKEPEPEKEKRSLVCSSYDTETSYESGSEHESDNSTVESSTDDEIEHTILFQSEKENDTTTSSLRFVPKGTPDSMNITKAELKLARRRSKKYMIRTKMPLKIKLTMIEQILSFRGRSILNKDTKQRHTDKRKKRRKEWENIKLRYYKKGLKNKDVNKVENHDIVIVKSLLNLNEVTELEKERRRRKKSGDSQKADTTNTDEHQNEQAKDKEDLETNTEEEHTEVEELLKSSPPTNNLVAQNMIMTITPSKDKDKRKAGGHERAITLSGSSVELSPNEKIAEKIKDLITQPATAEINDPDKWERETNMRLLKIVNDNGGLKEIKKVDPSIVGGAKDVTFEMKESEYEKRLKKTEDIIMSKNEEQYILRQIERVVTIKELHSKVQSNTEPLIHIKEDTAAVKNKKLQAVREAMKDDTVYVHTSGPMKESDIIEGFTQLGLVPKDVIKKVENRAYDIVDAIEKQPAYWGCYKDMLIDLMDKERNQSWHANLKLVLKKMQIDFVEMGVNPHENQFSFEGRVTHPMYMCFFAEIIGTSEPKRYGNKNKGKRKGKFNATKEVHEKLMDFLMEVYDEEGYDGVDRELSRMKRETDIMIDNIRYIDRSKRTCSYMSLDFNVGNKVFEAINVYNTMVPKRQFEIPNHSKKVQDEMIFKDYTQEMSSDVSDKVESRYESQDEVWKIFKRIIKCKSLIKIMVIDRALWERKGHKLLQEIEDHLSYFPLAILDREYAGMLDQVAVVQRNGPLLCYIFRLGMPLELREILLSNNIIITGDSSSIEMQLGSFPPYFLDLSLFSIDLPNLDKYYHETHKMGVAGRAKLLWNLNIQEIKDVKGTMFGGKSGAKERCEYGNFKGQGYVRKPTYPYASFDTWVDGTNAVFVFCLNSTFLLKKHWKLSKGNRIETLFTLMKNDKLMNKAMKPINPREEIHHEGIKNWKAKRVATKKSYIPKIKSIQLPSMAFNEDSAVAKIIIETSIKDHGRLKGVKEVINEKTGIMLGKRGASKVSDIGRHQDDRDYYSRKGNEPRASNLGIKTSGIDIDFNRWKSPTRAETAAYTAGYSAIIPELLDSLELDDADIRSKGNSDLDKAARRLKVKIQNDGYVNFERHEDDDLPEHPRLRFNFDELAYYLEHRFNHNHMMAAAPEDMLKTLKRIEVMEKEGRGLKINLKEQYEVIVKNMSTSYYTVQLTNNGRLPLWAMVQEPGITPLMARAFPMKMIQLSVSKKFVEDDGIMMVWTHVTECYALGAHQVVLADHNPTLKSKRKRTRSDISEIRSESVVDVIVLDGDEDDVFSDNLNWWEKQAASGDRDGASSNFKPGTKRHKSTNN